MHVPSLLQHLVRSYRDQFPDVGHPYLWNTEDFLAFAEARLGERKVLAVRNLPSGSELVLDGGLTLRWVAPDEELLPTPVEEQEAVATAPGPDYYPAVGQREPLAEAI